MSSQCSWSSLTLNTPVTQWLVITAVVPLVLPSVLGLVSCWYFLCLIRDHNDSFFICISCSHCSPGAWDAPNMCSVVLGKRDLSHLGSGSCWLGQRHKAEQAEAFSSLLSASTFWGWIWHDFCTEEQQMQELLPEPSLKHFFRQTTGAQCALLSCFVQTT